MYHDQPVFDILHTWKVNSINRRVNLNLSFSQFVSKVRSFMKSLAFLYL